MKPKKTSKLREQRHAARREIQSIGIKPPASTFPRQTTPSDYALRRLQKRRINIKALIQMIESKDPVLMRTAAERITDKKIRKQLNTTTLEKLARHPDQGIRVPAAKALTQDYAQQKNIPELTKLTKHPNPHVRTEAANTLAQTHAKQGNIAELKKLTKHRDSYVRWRAANALAQTHAKQGNIAELKKLTEHPNSWVSQQAKIALAQTHAKQGNIAELKKLTKQPNPHVVRWEVANALVQTHAKQGNIAELKKLTKHRDSYVCTEAKNALNYLKHSKARKLLLRTKKPFAATAHLPEILKKTKALNAVASQLRNEFGQDFVGIVVFGSTAKGYARPKSDVDYAVIASDQKAAARFREISEQKGLPLCSEHYVNPNTKNTNIAPLFYGLFFGNRKALTQAQKTTLQQISPEEWNQTRTQIHQAETHLDKLFKRYNISPREQQRIKIAAALRVPPPYSEMKKLLGIK